MIAMHGWLTVLRQWLGVEPRIQERAPHPPTTSDAEKHRIDNRIESTRRELDMLLAHAALDEWRSRHRGDHDAPAS